MSLESILPLAGAWLWNTYGKTLTGLAFNRGKEKWDEAKWESAAKAYRAKIFKIYNSMQIMGMAKPVALDDIFTDVYVLDKPTAFKRFEIETLKSLSKEPGPSTSKRVNGLRIVRDKHNLFILGKPGAGKTTFLKYLALQAAQQNIDRIPIFIALKEWADSGKDLMLFLTERFKICEFPVARPFVEELLNSGTAMVLFDGLDEVSQERGERDQQIRSMNEFVQKYDKTQCLITCRIAATDYSFQPFSYVEIADFSDKQVKTFVGNWFRREDEKDLKTYERFIKELEEPDNKGLRDLARTPLLLTLLCLAFNETLSFPRRRAEIYKEAVDALLKKWDSSRRIKRDEVYQQLSIGHKENMLARIAAETFEDNEYFIPQARLEKFISDYVKNVPPHDPKEVNAAAVLKSIEADNGIFVERAREIYSFSHLTIQEYFTAKYVVANVHRGALVELIKSHCTDDRWREVFLLTTSLLLDATDFMKAFRSHIEDLLCNDQKLGSLLAWADKDSSIGASRWLTRSMYLFIERFHATTNPGLMSALAQGFMASKLLHDELYLDHRLSLDIAYAHGRSEHIRDILAGEIEIIRKLGLNGLSTALEELVVPTPESSEEEWQLFEDRFRSVLIEHRDIGHEWDLTEEQETLLAKYLSASFLLQDCLELAFISPAEKSKLQQSLLLSPPQ